MGLVGVALPAVELKRQRAVSLQTCYISPQVMGLAIVCSEGLVFEGCKQLDPEGFLRLLVQQAHFFEQELIIDIMGASSSALELKVASLNYAGISHNPFEFYSGTSEQRVQLRLLSGVFQELLKQEFHFEKIEGSFKWELKNIDKFMQRERYCPIYRQDAGVIHGRLLTRDKFEKKWHEEFAKNRHYVQFKEEPSKEEIERCLIYDFLIFKSIVEFVFKYRVKKNTRVKSMLEDRDPDDQARKTKQVRLERKELVIAYEEFLEEHFSKDFLKHSTKLEAVKRLLGSKDVVFLQDVSDQLINSLKNEGCVNIINFPCRECAILVKENRKKFQKIYDERKILEEFEKEKFAEFQEIINHKSFKYDQKKPTTSVCFLDNFLFVSLHLSSPKEQKGQWPDILKFIRHLLSLRERFPSLHIVGGGDFNREIHQMQSRSDKEEVGRFFKAFQFFPKKSEKQNTTWKKRTWLQSQRKKADVDDKMCRDFLFSDLPIRDGRIELLGGAIGGGENKLLTNEHPFDHYIVSGTIEGRRGK